MAFIIELLQKKLRSRPVKQWRFLEIIRSIARVMTKITAITTYGTSILQISLRCRWQTRATQWLMPTVLYRRRRSVW